MAADVKEGEETPLQEEEEEEESEEEDGTELAYPDTVIQLQHVGGDRCTHTLLIIILLCVCVPIYVHRFELQRSVSAASSTLDTHDS